jgi:uncharacterized membrane protein
VVAEEDFPAVEEEVAEAAQVVDGNSAKPNMNEFLTEKEEQALVREIRAVEARSSAELRVVITTKLVFRPMRHGWKLFDRLGMHRTNDRNGALILVIPMGHRFAVIGDNAWAEVVGPAYWEELSNAMSRHLRAGRRYEALAYGIRTLGATMAGAWPANGENPNELPNEIVYE